MKAYIKDLSDDAFDALLSGIKRAIDAAWACDELDDVAKLAAIGRELMRMRGDECSSGPTSLA